MTIEACFAEINFRKEIWLICCPYNPENVWYQKESYKNYDLLSSKFDNIILIRDFIAGAAIATVYDFCEIIYLVNLVKKRTCFKNLIKPTCIDSMVTNKPKWFQGTTVIEPELLDFHNMCVTVVKTDYNKKKPSIADCRKF